MLDEMSATRTANAPAAAVWNVLADYQNISAYTGQVKTSVLEGEQATGVGAVRTCELAPMGATREVVTGWVDGESITMEVEAKGMPVKGSVTTFSVKAVDDTSSELTMATRVQPKDGFFGSLVGRRMEKRMPKIMGSLLEDLSAAAESADN